MPDWSTTAVSVTDMGLSWHPIYLALPSLLATATWVSH